jgi:undecaprenyl-diphosphatase
MVLNGHMRRTLSRSSEFWRDVKKGRASAVRNRMAVAGIVAIILGTTFFFYLGQQVMTGDTQRFDKWAVDSLRNRNDVSLGRGPLWLSGAIRDITAFGSVAVVAMISLAAIGLALLTGTRRLALLMLFAAGGGFLINMWLKELYDRPRPQLPHVMSVPSRSFPSGHAMVAASVYLSLGAVLATREERRIVKVYFVCLALVLTGLVGLSRVYLGFHYPTDVLAGWTAGGIWALLCALATWAAGEHS